MKSGKSRSDKQQQAKNELLRELESLREQLVDPDSELTDEEIPLLLDKVEHAIADAPADTDTEQSAEEPVADNNVLPGQQPLFEKRLSSETEPAPATRPTAHGENPFLPKHIRDRLDERRRALADDIAQATDSYRRSMAGRDSPSAASEPDEQAIVDDLIAQYLPRIEAELRFRLARKLEQSRTQDNPEEDSG